MIITPVVDAVCLASRLSTNILVRYLEIYSKEEASRGSTLFPPFVLHVQHFVWHSVQFPAVYIRQAHCGY